MLFRIPIARRGSCARAAETHAVAPPRNATKSRRLINHLARSAPGDMLPSIRRVRRVQSFTERGGPISAFAYFYAGRRGGLGRVLINSCTDIRFRGIAAQRRRASVFLARYPCE